MGAWECEPKGKSTVAQIRSLPWVTYIGTPPREDATHRIETDCGAVRPNEELRELENLGAEIVSISAVPQDTVRLYVEV